MYINTTSKESMQCSICNYLNVSPSQLHRLFSSAAKKAQASSYINGDIFNGELDSFVYDHMPSFPIDEISFFHLSRRLNNCIDDYNGNNLMDLLTMVNPLSQFLKEHQVKF